jgi:hypothetical protein
MICKFRWLQNRHGKGVTGKFVITLGLWRGCGPEPDFCGDFLAYVFSIAVGVELIGNWMLLVGGELGGLGA